MCGLIGYSGEKNFNNYKIATLMIWNSLERGVDATGVYTPEKGISKSLLSGREYVFKNKLHLSKIFIGHVRAATVGNKTDIQNAHPFKHGNYVLAHNGTLTNYKDLASLYKIDNKYQVDSDILCASIAASNDLKTIGQLQGAAALLIQDTKDKNTLYAYRNKERPLYYGYLDNSMYISSIGDSLSLIGCKNIKEFTEDFLYTISNGNIISKILIVNKPYKEPVLFQNNDPSLAELKTKYIGKNLRSKWTCKGFSTSFDYDLKEGNWYTVMDAYKENNTLYLDVYDVTDVKSTHTKVPVYYFKIEDIINEGDFIIPLYDLPLVSPCTYYQKEIGLDKLFKNTLYKASYFYKDGSMLVNYPGDNKSFYNTGAYPVYLFRKATEEEVKEYKVIHYLNIDNNTTTDSSNINNTGTDTDSNNDEVLIAINASELSRDLLGIEEELLQIVTVIQDNTYNAETIKQEIKDIANYIKQLNHYYSEESQVIELNND